MTEAASIQADSGSLGALEARARQDMDYLCLPPSNWVPARRHGSERVHDVTIIGGGMCGALVYHALRSGGMRNVRIFDRAEAHREGPWVTYARMDTLRSPKQLTGPAYGHASLTFRAWFTAQFGEAEWERLDKIPRTMWMDYLIWYRKVLDIPVENRVTLERVEPEGGYLRLALAGDGASEASVLTRKLIMATGRDGTGAPHIPDFVAGLPRHLWAHSADDIDFAALKDRRVVVVGIGASSVDNSAEALEAGAREVRHLIRRAEMPTINKLMGIGSFGFTAGYAQLPDEWRWRFMHYSFATQTPAPRGSTLRVSRHENAYFHFGHGIARVRNEGEEVVIETTAGKTVRTDFLILATGFTVNPLSRTELGDAAGEVLLWRDRYAPPPGEEDSELANFPYLNADFTFAARHPDRAGWLSNIYCFNYGASASLGKVSGDIPGISEGAAWMTREIAATLYREDVETHWQSLQDYSKPELLGDEWTASEIEEAAPARAPALASGG